MTAFSGMCAVFSVPGIFDPGKAGVGLQVLSAAFLGLLVYLTYRSATAGVRLDGNNVTYRALVSIRRWPTRSVRRFEAREARVGLVGYHRQVVWIALRDGPEYKLEMLNFGPTDPRALETVAALNARLSN